ncbi:MAG: response regulator, partial [Chloroflexia bacterium]
MRLNVLIVDDEPLPRQGLRMLLADHPAVNTIAEARNGPEALALIASERPDLVLLDVQMPQMDGFQVIDAIHAEQMPAVIFVTAHDAYALRAFEVNAIDYLLKPVNGDRLHDALDRAK